MLHGTVVCPVCLQLYLINVAKLLDGSRCHLVRRQASAPVSPRKGAEHPHFSAHVYCGQTAGWIRIPLGTEVSLGPGDIVLHGDPAPPRKAAQQPPTFRSMTRGQTVAHLSN